MKTLDRSWKEAKLKYDAAVKQYGRGSRVANERWRDLMEITNRILKRDRRRAA